ncbi:hypothetical protein [Amycolatopsis alkalitolerans]|uniref:Uncharacterized protein n=1 Tax=Amycolatopsis alkalitolerans TaxID=2547244 RepID=A0A5C4M729_9PSEU|nr:hypothetical protein [Amycolatopsis alkalitolerans]TNC28673.1 hypothetical protein FG385_05330 [Amycolatopsis alkalitolerans]
MGDPFNGAVSWDNLGDDRIGVCHPGYVGLFRVHVDGLLKLARRRLAEHERGELGRLDPRLDSVLWMRRLGENIPAAAELDVLQPAANRFQAVLDLLPSVGGVLVLHGWQDRYLVGTVALDVKVAIEAWLRAWSLGELVDGRPCPDAAALRVWQRQCRWLGEQIVDPLQPEPEAA